MNRVDCKANSLWVEWTAEASVACRYFRFLLNREYLYMIDKCHVSYSHSIPFGIEKTSCWNSQIICDVQTKILLSMYYGIHIIFPFSYSPSEAQNAEQTFIALHQSIQKNYPIEVKIYWRFDHAEHFSIKPINRTELEFSSHYFP